MHGAVAVDFGATSGRFAVGRLEDGAIRFEIVRQIPHSPVERSGKLHWDFATLLALCREASSFGRATFGECTLGIDTWGVDHGFIDRDGRLIDDPVCYRDLSHLAAFETLKPHRERLYALTGTQHQPFNTICQLVARRTEDPSLPSRSTWMILPDLMGYLLTGQRNNEVTQASTTQLLGLDGRWSPVAFDIAGWPAPNLEPALPGFQGAEIEPGVRLAYVGSHDTASAVCGFGRLAPEQAFLNVGTWSLVGAVVARPIATPECESAAFTNERTVDGQVRLLKNIPGFYVINRIHEELGIGAGVPQWLECAESVDERVDLLDPLMFNPVSMVEACADLAGRRPKTDGEWAGLALSSLTRTIAAQPKEISKLTGREIRSLRVGGGGSQSEAFCQSLADESGLVVHSGPAEATVLGNLAMQFLASGAISSRGQMNEVLGRSAQLRTFAPEAGSP